MTPNGVAFSGKAGTGKTTVAQALAESLIPLGHWPLVTAFGDFVKEMTLEEKGLTKEDPGGREALIEVGERQRQHDPDFWIKALHAYVDPARKAGCFPIIHDVRRVNEFDYCWHHGFLIVRLEAPTPDRCAALRRRGEAESFLFSDHPTETDLDGFFFNCVIHNDHGSGAAATARMIVDRLAAPVHAIAPID